MKKPRKIVYTLQEKIDVIINSLAPGLGMKGYITDTYKGKSYFEGFFSVPLWAYRKGVEYFTYYVAHELAHQIRYKRFDQCGYHDDKFYSVFKKVCPKELQSLELHYKKSFKKYIN